MNTAPSSTTHGPGHEPAAAADTRQTRLPDATRVGGVYLRVTNLARSIAFYRDIIGLQVLETSGHVAALAPFGSRDALVTLHEAPGVNPVARRGTYGLYHFAILLPDRAALGRFVTHLIRAGVRYGMSDHLVSEAIYLNDPDGLGIEVYIDRPRDAWPRLNGQLTMATDPLDVASLLRAAGTTAWNGAPAGTTMGHIHLHVGDLERARRFYADALGFDVVVDSYPGALFMSAGGYHHHLGTNTWAPGPSPSPDQAQLLEWTLIVPTLTDAHRVAERLLAAGAPAFANGDDWLVTDPWGTPLRITVAR